MKFTEIYENLLDILWRIFRNVEKMMIFKKFGWKPKRFIVLYYFILQI